MSVRLPKFPGPYVLPDSSFYRGAGAPEEIERLLVEWAQCSDDINWVFSPRGRLVDSVLEAWEFEQGR